jgi:cyclopropane fatty-acyl-phospholipid synthase-like methyltransferase
MYNHKEFFDWEIASGHCQTNAVYRELHHGFGKWLVNAYKKLDGEPLRTLDFGCGTGTLVEFLIYRGVDAYGLTINKYEHAYFVERNPRFAERLILLDGKTIWDPEKPFDVITCIEVFEHMTDAMVDRAAVIFKSICKTLIFSSTPKKSENDEELGHINIRPTEDWIKHFEDKGFKLVSKPEIPTLWTLEFEK